ncbi:nitroreductase family deazaflavin-dependent oxidoreductase [Streptomyces sp. NBC_01456]|uniref:nitroreductase family deazaflavin-dependent oxidoreductase n=1 Tax=unclassified Streptomyces TaxID=2593676 RepID=UPI002E360F05|nr:MULTISPECIES: nitroreductase family deazaflavin-dependent oxidoreductase [unclassified Streptomyces]
MTPFSTQGRPQLPTGWRRVLVRLPIRLYRAGLGPLFGKRLLLLHHTGRRTGLRRSVVLEVIAYERDGDRLSWTVASGFGPAAAWYQNLRHTPRGTIRFGTHHYTTTAHFLPPEDGAALMARYAPRHPRLARRLCAFMGFDVDGSEAAFRTAGRSIPFVRLESTPG